MTHTYSNVKLVAILAINICISVSFQFVLTAFLFLSCCWCRLLIFGMLHTNLDRFGDRIIPSSKINLPWNHKDIINVFLFLFMEDVVKFYIWSLPFTLMQLRLSVIQKCAYLCSALQSLCSLRTWNISLLLMLLCHKKYFGFVIL